MLLPWRILSVVGVILAGALVMWVLYRYQALRMWRLETTILEKLGERTGARPRMGQKKRDAFSRVGPKTFYYLDETQIKQLHEQVSEQLEPKEIETQEALTTDKGIKGVLKMVEPRYRRLRSVQTKKKYEIEHSSAAMYNAVEKYLFEKGDVSFGIEDFEFDEASVSEFRSMCTQMKEKFDFAIPDDLQENFVSDRMRGLAMEAIDRLSHVSGYVAVQAEFVVSTTIQDQRVLHLFAHPLNRHLGSEDTKVSIEIRCSSDLLTPAGNAALEVDHPVKIACVGKVVRWDSDDRTLVISPIAVY